MSDSTHNTAPTQFVETGGVRYAYRKFGAEGGTPLLFLMHFRGGMDNWDPLVTDGLAAKRQVILFDNRGVSSSSGETPATFDAMADDAAAFVEALGLPKVDVLGFSIGGYVATALAQRHPKIARRLVLVGTGTRAGEPPSDPKILQIAGNPVPTEEDFLYLFFSPSKSGKEAGRAFWKRRHERQDQDTPSSVQTMKAQVAALMENRNPRGERFSELNEIEHPALVVNGNNDVMIPTINAYNLSKHLPNAQLIIYPDAGHGAHFQYPELFVAHTELFLDAA